MTLNSKKRNNPFPIAGAICPNCREHWEKHNKPTQTLVALPMRTLRHKHTVAVCPYCDGDLILLRAA